MKEKSNLSYDVGESIVRWSENGGDFPTQEVEVALSFCKGNIAHRKIVVKQILIHCLSGCNRREIQVIENKLKAITENPPTAQLKRTIKRKF